MKELNLMTACGSRRATVTEIIAVSTPEPTETHRPIPHGLMIKQAASALTDYGMVIAQEAHALTADGSGYFGMMEIRNGHSDWSTVVGLRNSHNKRFSAGFVCGSGVLVCDNLCFFGDIKVGRRHTANILNDLPGLLYGAVEKLGGMREVQAERLDSYKRIEITEPQIYPILIRALDAGVISSAQIAKVLAEFREPSHAEFAQSSTAWRLFNAFTEVLTPREGSAGIFSLAPKTEKLHRLLDAACGL